MLHVAIVVLVVAHGIGHLLFLGNAWGYWAPATHDGPLLGSGAGHPAEWEQVVGLLWLIPLVGFIAVAYGVVTDQGWWQFAALLLAGISALLIVLWWAALPVQPATSALAFNLLLMVFVLARYGTEIVQP
jgi:hypothetical protein